MAENNLKYYTPEIEDFYIGYEFEFAGLDNYWNKLPFTKHKILKSKEEYFGLFTFEWLDSIYKETDNLKVKDYLRVSYLTKEDIESEGWKFKQSFNSRHSYEKGNFLMAFDEKEFTLEFFPIDPCKLLQDTYIRNPELFRFFCRAKSVNELRIIEKLLEIENE